MAPDSPPISRQQAVTGICASLHRAYRDLRLYPEGHPAVRQALDGLVARVQKYLDEEGSLVLDVEENGLLHNGQVVYASDSSQDNMAFLMFRDGLRSISIRSGVESEELEGFARRLAHADDLDPNENDLATVLWEDDFAHIDYGLVDLFLEGEVLADGAIEALRDIVLTRLQETGPITVSEAATAADELEVVELRPTDTGNLTLTEEELARGEMVATLPSTTLEEFAVVLFELLGSYPWQIKEEDGFHRALVTVVGSYVVTGQLERIDFLIGRLRDLEAQGRCTPGFVGSVLSSSVTPGGLNQLLMRARQLSAVENAHIQEFLLSVQRWVMPALLQLLADTPDRALRRGLLALLGEGGGVPGSLLSPLLADSRWYVVRNAVQLAALSPDETLMDELERLIRHPEVQVRREVVRTLTAFGGARAVKLITKFLSDDDSSVRVLAAGGIGRLGGPEHEPLILGQIDSRGFEARAPDEISAFLLAYASLAGEQAVARLERLWKSRLFDSHALPVRMAALKALGTIRGPRARASLQEAARSGGGQVRREAERTLQELLAREQGPIR